MSRFERLLQVATSATPERLERCERILYPHAARAMRAGVLIDSQLERVLKTLSEQTGVGVRSINKAYRTVAAADPARHDGTEQVGPYSIREGRITLEKGSANGPVKVPLCSFVARIVEERERDDGIERTLVMVLEGALLDGRPLPTVEVSAPQFAAMNWPVAEWGSRAVVYAGQGTKDHLRTAVQMLSGDVPRRIAYTHLGWREIDGKHYFLHAGGAIGPDSADDLLTVQVDPPQGLEPFELPQAPKDDELVQAVRSSIGTLDLAPDEVTVPLLGSVYRAVLGGVDFGLHLAGQTGAGKSELAAVMQQHFGPGLDARNLPGSWSSTANALEGLAFSAKDVVAVVDDFAPEGSTHDVARYHATAARLFRAQGNSAGRGRMRADGSLRAPRPPRGLILSTGEDIPKGHSIKARTLILELDPGALDWERLGDAQRLASGGVYASALAGFIHWLAADYAAHLAAFKAHHASYRDSLQRTGHKRTVDAGAQLLAAYQMLLTFALEINALTQAEYATLWQRLQSGILDALEPQASFQAQSDPVARFSELLIGLFTSGRAHVVDAATGDFPGDGWGWEVRSFEGQYGLESSCRSKGNRIGWLDGINLYLEPSSTYAELQRFARDQGESVPVSERTLWKRLSERGLLLSKEATRLTVRKQGLAGANQRAYVLHLEASYVLQTEPTGPSEPQPVLDGVNPPLSVVQLQNITEPQPISGPRKSELEAAGGSSGPVGPQNTGVESPLYNSSGDTPAEVHELYQRFCTGELKGVQLHLQGRAYSDLGRTLGTYFEKKQLNAGERSDLLEIALAVASERETMVLEW